MRTHLELAERNRALQVELASNAMEESFVRLVQENEILASYSFLEYENGQRSDSSINALLDSEMRSYAEVIAYCYFSIPAVPRLMKARPGGRFVVQALADASASLWESFSPGDGPVVLSSPSHETEPYFMVFLPVFSDGAMRGLLGTAVGLAQAIDKYMKPLSAGTGRRSFIMFGAGRILWASDDLNPSLFAIEEDSLLTSRSFRLGNGEFTIMADENRSSLVADLYGIETPRLLVLISGMLVFAAAMFAANRIYLERRTRLALAAEEQRLSARIAARELELKESEARFRKLFEGANDAIFIMDEDGRISECNGRAVSLFGRPADAILGRRPSELSPPLQRDGTQSRARERSILGKVLEGGSAIFEWEHTRGDGSIVEVEVSISPLVLGERRMYQALLRDVTERNRNDSLLRDALEDREILLCELHHRVKNNFQFLESLIELQKGGEPDDIRHALSKIQSRTSALAAAYLITAERPDSLKVDIREYLNVLSSQVVDGTDVGSRFEVDIDCKELPLSLDVAVSLGLLYREILTNAVIHGYEHAALGRIDVRFGREGNLAALRVRDYGKGFPDGAADGLGLTIARALVQQLNGTLGIEPRSPGTSVEALFPLA